MGNQIFFTGWPVAMCMLMGVSVSRVLAKTSLSGLGETHQTDMLMVSYNPAGPNAM